MLTYAIGDIHGCRVQFEQMLAKIEEHANGREHLIVTLGDYIDRGPDSKGVIDILRSRPDIIKLVGNHEGMLIDAFDKRSPTDYYNFEMNGGFATLKSFGVKRVDDIPGDYIQFLKSGARYYYEDGLRVYVHAGINPNITDMSQQHEHVLTWIRNEFLDINFKFHKYVVHGHTPVRTGKADVRENRCNLDTFCYFGGPLSCGVFDDTQEKPIEILEVTR